MLSRIGFVVIVGISLGGCASNKIDVSELPPEAFADDGVDYYSVDLGDVPSSGSNQWRLAENGEKINVLRRGALQDTDFYYVGDIRYLRHEEQVLSQRRGTDINTTNRTSYGSNVQRDPRLRRPVPNGIRYRTPTSNSTPTSSSNGSSGSASQPAAAPSTRAPRSAPTPRVRNEPKPRPRPTRTPTPTREIDR